MRMKFTKRNTRQITDLETQELDMLELEFIRRYHYLITIVIREF